MKYKMDSLLVHLARAGDEDACHQKILDQLEEILIRFRENKFDDLLKTENYAELEKLNDQLEAIGHHIQLLKEEAREEKENTKEMVSDISHQLKTPVAALDTCFSALKQNEDVYKRQLYDCQCSAY